MLCMHYYTPVSSVSDTILKCPRVLQLVDLCGHCEEFYMYVIEQMLTVHTLKEHC